MRIIFVHRTIVDYTVETPYLRAVGGTEAAISYLAAELASLGHSVVHLANTSAPGTYLGVQCANHHAALGKELLNGADVVVVEGFPTSETEALVTAAFKAKKSEKTQT